MMKFGQKFHKNISHVIKTGPSSKDKIMSCNLIINGTFIEGKKKE